MFHAICRRQASDIEADDVILTNIRSNDDGDGVSFDMYVQSSDNVVLNQQAILQAVEVNTIVKMPLFSY